MRMNATENKANFRANEPSVMIGRFQPRFHSLRGRRLKGKGKGPLEKFSRAQNSLSLPFQTPATQAIVSIK